MPQNFLEWDTNCYGEKILVFRDLIIPNDNASIAKNHFLLFTYTRHKVEVKHSNLGDFIQSIATKSAISTLFPQANFTYFDRDSLTSFHIPAKEGEGNILIPAAMQGWFARNSHFIPNNEILPIFVGTHFTPPIYQFLEYFVIYYPWFFQNKDIGCRDFETLRFCKDLGLNAYLSRCLTMTLPRRDEVLAKNVNDIFLVNLAEEYLPYIPQDIQENAQKVNQRYVDYHSLSEDLYTRSLNLLDDYKKRAKLVITGALHCASPCIAMGIPVVLISKDEETINRFSALKGIVPIWTFEDLKNGRVNFNPQSVDIESLKKDMLENLRLSILQEFGESVDMKHLAEIRKTIAEFDIVNK